MAHCNESFIDGVLFPPNEGMPGQESKDELSRLLTEFEKETIGLEAPTDSGSQDLGVLGDLSPPKPPMTRIPSTSTKRNKKQKTKSKADSGLRRFSQDVLEEVKQKGVTSFDDVADEMFRRLPSDKSHKCAQKNVRRRVYDILNVLVAMDIVSKDRKEVTWVGLPAEIPEEELQLQQEKGELEESIQQKTAELQHLITQQIAYKNLLQSKMDVSSQTQTSTVATSPIHLPFIAVRTSRNTVISHATSKDKLDHVFDFEQPFQIHDNMEVLMRMGMAFGLETKTCSQKNLEVSRTMVSKELHPYLEDMAKPDSFTTGIK